MIPEEALRLKAWVEHTLKPDYIIGVDEVGYGAWAGPLTVGGVALIRGWEHKLVKDSKSLSSTKREKAFPIIEEAALTWTVEYCPAVIIDEIGLGVALQRLNACVILKLLKKIPHGSLTVVVMDGNMEVTHPLVASGVVQCLVVATPKADVAFSAVSAASIMAKVSRDREMAEYHRCYPQYCWDRNKGYGTPHHVDALRNYGPCELHRMSYQPLQELNVSRIKDGEKPGS